MTRDGFIVSITGTFSIIAVSVYVCVCDSGDINPDLVFYGGDQKRSETESVDATAVSKLGTATCTNN